MSHRVRELAEREATLQLRVAVQRRELAREFDGIGARLRSVDRGVAYARGVLVHPAVVPAALGALVIIWRANGFRLIGRGLLLAAAVRRLLRIAKKI